MPRPTVSSANRTAPRKEPCRGPRCHQHRPDISRANTNIAMLAHTFGSIPWSRRIASTSSAPFDTCSKAAVNVPCSARARVRAYVVHRSGRWRGASLAPARGLGVRGLSARAHLGSQHRRGQQPHQRRRAAGRQPLVGPHGALTACRPYQVLHASHPLLHASCAIPGV